MPQERGHIVMFRFIPLVVGLLVAALAASGCESDPVGPGVGGGNLLQATVNGTPVTFQITAGSQSYDAISMYGTFHGAVSGSVTRGLLVTFIADINNGTYPRVLRDPDARFTYVEISGSDTSIFDCVNPPADCSLTLSASNGSIVDGTFSVVLTTRVGGRQVALNDGRFSVKVR